MENKQTPVEWLREKYHSTPQSQFGNLFDQAIEMEKHHESTTPRTDEIENKLRALVIQCRASESKEQEGNLIAQCANELTTTTRTDAEGWISVQDRLPEHGKYVLAHYYETPLLKMINRWKYNKDNPHWTNGTFTHWMPLPEPPNQFRKEGEQK